MRADFSEMIRLGASFNDYVFFGGTNFGLMNGANYDDHYKHPFAAELTTYDYDAALTEWGDYTKRYYDIRELLSEVSSEPLPPVPERPKFQHIGRVELTESASLFEHDGLASITHSVTAEPMEHYGQDYGYIRYSKKFTYDAPYEYMALYGVSDRAHVYLNGELLGIRMRSKNSEEAIPLPCGLKKGDVLDVLVENMGRINFGSSTFRGDRKGILDGIYCYDRLMTDFTVYSYTMKNLEGINYKSGCGASLPAFFRGRFTAERGKECFVRFDSFKKGLIWVNGFMLGRYWEIGPQEALYLPASILREENEIVIFETDGLRGEPAVEITDKPALSGKTHGVDVE